MTMIRKGLLILCVTNILFIGSVFPQQLIIFHAGSLAKPVKEICDEFSKKYPDIEIIREAAGSRELAFKITQMDKPCDIILSADYSVFEEILMPDYSNWYLVFSTNEMVVIFSQWSKYGAEINENNWYDILTRPGVKIGRSSEHLDPCGYRALMVWQLAENYYNAKGLYQRLDKNCPPENVRPKAIELVAQIESLDLDYAFEYLSIAVQHRLQYIKLPEEINLGDLNLKESYKKARVKLEGPKGEFVISGSPIQYALTIPDNALHREEAVAFLKFLLSDEGRAISKNNGQFPYYRIEGNIGKDLQFLEEFK